jgi:hypothetical protein
VDAEVQRPRLRQVARKRPRANPQHLQRELREEAVEHEEVGAVEDEGQTRPRQLRLVPHHAFPMANRTSADTGITRTRRIWLLAPSIR